LADLKQDDGFGAFDEPKQKTFGTFEPAPAKTEAFGQF
jgi:hypothetical protein